jgi:hypothetical protein
MARLSTMRVWRHQSLLFALALGTYLALLSGIGTAQISPEKHSKHHPGAAQQPARLFGGRPAPTCGMGGIGK